MNMDDQAFTLTPGRAWLAMFGAAIVAIGGASIAFTRQVWDEFIWQYFWGPVYADAHNAGCAIKDGGQTLLGGSGFAENCGIAMEQGHIVAEPGYTLVSEAGYMVIGLFFLIGVYLLLKNLDVSFGREYFYALFPFMLFGGALRVVEDATDAAVEAGVEPVASYPLNTLFISPIIYFTVFGIAIGALVGSLRLADRGIVSSAERALGIIGSVAFGVTFGYLVVLGVTVEHVDFLPHVLLIIVGGATAMAYGVYALTERFAPYINSGTGYVGLIVLWAHAIDGVANVLITDWADTLALPVSYYPKHPANEIIMNVTEAVLPAGIFEAIGSAWPFLLVKLGVALGIVWLFDEAFIEENPRYSYVLLVGVVAVGLGPGSRDMLRAAFGI
ncbi:putative membrane protein [Halorhabdus sp. SVX81]|nr:putative membrane protein [Halorhabdus sp. SVX81]